MVIKILELMCLRVVVAEQLPGSISPMGAGVQAAVEVVATDLVYVDAEFGEVKVECLCFYIPELYLFAFALDLTIFLAALIRLKDELALASDFIGA